MKNYTPKIPRKHNQAGFTLIELAVVLLILVGLAGLLLPYVSNFDEDTKNSTSANNLKAVNNAIAQYETRYRAFPDKFDSLVNTSGTAALIDYFPTAGETIAPATANLELCSLTADSLKSLKLAEIDSLYYMKDGSATNEFDSATFNAEDLAVGTNGVVTLLDTGATYANKVACLTQPNGAGTLANSGVKKIVVDKMGVEVDGDDLSETATEHENQFVVFGIGQKTQMSGKTLTDAPVHFMNGNDNPTSKYGRYLAVFKVSKEGKRATYVGALTPDMKTTADFLEAAHAKTEDDD